jgi:hypothetical protein
MTALSLTHSDLTAALAAMAKPLLLHDALKLKRLRGDQDCAGFKLVAREFGSGLNATVGGALEAMRQWTRKGCIQLTPSVHAFVADLTALEDGTFTGETSNGGTPME